MKNTILFGFVCIAFLLCSCSDGLLEKNMSLVNSTGSEISVTDCSLDGDFSLPMSIESGESQSIVVRGAAESVSFKISFSDQNYSVSTGYVQDSSNICVEFTSDDGLAATVNAGNSSNTARVNLIQE